MKKLCMIFLALTALLLEFSLPVAAAMPGEAESIAASAADIDDTLSFDTSDIVKTVLIAVIVGFVIALIIVSVMKLQLKSVRMQPGASNYVRLGSLVLTRQDELYLYSHVTRVPRPKNDKK